MNAGLWKTKNLVGAFLSFFLFTSLLFTTAPVAAESPIPQTDHTPSAPLSSPASPAQPRYISGFGLDKAYTIFYEDRHDTKDCTSGTFRIYFDQTTTGPLGFAASGTPTNICDSHFTVKDWPITVNSTLYNYRAWGAGTYSGSHNFYVSNDLVNWTLVDHFTFTHPSDGILYGFHDILQINNNYVGWVESAGGRTYIVWSDNGDDQWTVIAQVGGATADSAPLSLYFNSGISGPKPSGDFVLMQLDGQLTYAKLYLRGDYGGAYLAINRSAAQAATPAEAEADFMNPADWTWRDGTTGLPKVADTAITSTVGSGGHDVREAWTVPASDYRSDHVSFYTGDYATGAKGLGWMAPPPPSVVWVDNNYDAAGCIADGHVWGTDCFATINDGIDAVASAGTVNVQTGIYNEQVNVSKALTLQGAGAADTIIDGTGLAVNPLVAISVTTGNVKLDGFTISNGGIPGGAHFQLTMGNGYPGNVVTVTNNIITCSGDDSNDDYGMYATGGLSDLIFSGNTISNCAYNGIFFERYRGATNIFSNTFTSLPGAAPVIGFMIYENPADPAGSQDVTTKQWVHDNQIDANGASGILFMAPYGASYNQYKGGRFTNVVISGNSIINVGDSSKGIQLEVDGDTGGFLNTVVSDNVLSAQHPGVGTSRGIRLLGQVNNTLITGNTISGFYRGVYQSYSFGVAGAGPSGTVLRNNIMSGNSFYGVENQYTASANVIDAVTNWWGAAGGPGPVGPGSGDKVSVNVTYMPWCTDITCTTFLPSPTGTLTTWSNTFRWAAVTGATWYHLEVDKADGTGVTSRTLMASTYCSGQICSISPAETASLINSNYKWRVQSYTGGAWQAWSDFITFTLNVLPCYTLTTVANPVGSGTVTPDIGQNCTGGYLSGTTVNLTEAPAGGYVFSNWSGAASGTSNPVAVVMSGNKSVTANFVPAIANSPSGTLSTWSNIYRWQGTPGATWYHLEVDKADGTTVTARTLMASTICTGLDCSISPAETASLVNGSYKWRVQVYVGGVWQAWPGFTTFTLNVVPCYTLTTVVSPLGSGTVTPDIGQNCTGGYLSGTTVNLTAAPAGGYAFLNWSGAASGSTNPLAVTMNANKSITANFVVTAVVSPSGTLTVWDGSFHWQGTAGATWYQLEVDKAGGTPVTLRTLSAATYCSGLNCAMTPAETVSLVNGNYKWQIRAYVGGIWQAWSGYTNFTLNR